MCGEEDTVIFTNVVVSVGCSVKIWLPENAEEMKDGVSGHFQS